MTRISTEQIIEILDEVGTLRLSKHTDREDWFVAETYDWRGQRLHSEVGRNLVELVNELHARL